MERLTFPYKAPPGIRRSPGEKPLFPLLPIELNKIRFYGLLDSGASSVLIPREIAETLNLDLKPCEGHGKGVGGTYERATAKVNLTIGAGTKKYPMGEVDACVPVQTQRDLPILIGRHPVFERFKIIFEEYKDKFILEPISME